MSIRSLRSASPLATVLAVVLFAAGCAGDEATDDAPADDAPAEDAPAEDDTDEDEPTGDGGYDVEEQPGDAAAVLVSPADGDTVTSPVPLEMSAEAVDIVPADAPEVGEAHLHVIVDAGCAETGELIPGPSDEAAAEGYNHFGDGSTEGEIELEPGEYELCVQLADGVHRAFGETQVVSITVE
jgi:hypothetical protein